MKLNQSLLSHSASLRKLTVAAALTTGALFAGTAAAAVLYSNGFETNTTDWSGVTRVASGTDGVASASGSFHAQASPGAFTRWNGYNYGAGNNVPTVFQEYWTNVDIYLDIGGGWSNDTRFDFSSAISNAAGGFLRDFVFNAGFYNDASGPGAGTDRFVISTGNNAGRANSFPKNGGAIAISDTGWYTFESHFYNDGGILQVEMNILDAADVLVNSWTLGSDPIATVGGNRYGWLVNSEFGAMEIDNAAMRTADAAVPEPATLALLGLGLAGLALRRRKQA